MAKIRPSKGEKVTRLVDDKFMLGYTKLVPDSDTRSGYAEVFVGLCKTTGKEFPDPEEGSVEL